jgi:hypothetical protein
VAERGRLDRLLAPRRVFLLLAAAILVTALFTPLPSDEDQAGSLSSYVASPAGARGFYELLERLGRNVDRRVEPMRQALDRDVIYLILEPGIPLTASEVHRLLEAVRSGAKLLTVPELQGRLADSLGVSRAPVLPQAAATAGENRRVFVSPDSTRTFGPGWVRWVLRPAGEHVDGAVYVPPDGATTLLLLDTEHGREPMVVGMPLGQGRIIMAAEPGLFRNSTLRNDPGAIRAVRYVEWLSTAQGDAIVFDEYHHGHGTHANVLREASRALTETAPGRVVLQAAVAGLLLLLAVGARPIRPAPRARIERRSPLEHVGALARAYAAVQASARSARLLVRGLQRRHHGTRAGDEMAWLRAVGRQTPDVQGDVERLRGVMEGTTHTVSATQVVASVARIERALGS